MVVGEDGAKPKRSMDNCSSTRKKQVLWELISTVHAMSKNLHSLDGKGLWLRETKQEGKRG